MIAVLDFFKAAHCAFDVVPTFDQRLGVPFATLRGEEIAAIDVDCAGHPRDWICDRMNNVVT